MNVYKLIESFLAFEICGSFSEISLNQKVFIALCGLTK